MHEHDCNLRAKWTSKQNKWKRKNWSRTAKNVIILLFYYKAHGTRTHSAHFSLPRIVCDMFVRVQAYLLRHCIIISTNFNLRVNRDQTNAEVIYLMHTRKKVIVNGFCGNEYFSTCVRRTHFAKCIHTIKSHKNSILAAI